MDLPPHARGSPVIPSLLTKHCLMESDLKLFLAMATIGTSLYVSLCQLVCFWFLATSRGVVRHSKTSSKLPELLITWSCSINDNPLWYLFYIKIISLDYKYHVYKVFKGRSSEFFRCFYKGFLSIQYLLAFNICVFYLCSI